MQESANLLDKRQAVRLENTLVKDWKNLIYGFSMICLNRIIKKSWIGQEELLDKAAYSRQLDWVYWLRNMAAADADEGPSRLPEQNTGGSDALCLDVPPVQGKQRDLCIWATIQAHSGRT
jgi:hypothetical protein